MKYNLKALKQRICNAQEEYPDGYIDPEFKEWLVGFEKELRRKLQLMEYLKLQNTVMDSQGFINFVKEILGE